jgi:hypothetical protein
MKAPPQAKPEARALAQRRVKNPEATSAVPPIVNEVLASPGQPLDPGIRTSMESRFGHDFSRVRVHTDARAAESARAVNAFAYTVGPDIVFDAGQYTPHTPVGRHLIAHELTHTVQQSRAASSAPLALGRADDALERRADAAAARANDRSATGPAVAAGSAGVPRLQRKSKSEALQEIAADEAIASFIRAFHSSPQTTPTAMLIPAARQLLRNFNEPLGPRTQAAAAKALVAIYFELVERAKTTPRAKADRALLKTDAVTEVIVQAPRVFAQGGEGSAEGEPWTPARPKSVEEIRIDDARPPVSSNLLFSEENVREWAGAAADSALEISTPASKPKPAARSKAAAKAQSPIEPQPAVTSAPTPQPPVADQPPSRVVGSDLEQQSPTESEEVSADMMGEKGFFHDLLSQTIRDVLGEQQSVGGSDDIARGLASLRGTTMGDVMEVVRQRMKEASAGLKDTQVIGGASAGLSLFDVTGVIWYVANGLYIVDRSGHLVPGGKLRYSLKATSLDPGTYFLGQFNLGYRDADVAYSHNILFRVDGKPGIVDEGDLFGTTISHDLLPLFTQAQDVLKRKAGVVFIISPGIVQDPIDFNTDHVMTAIKGVPRHVEWAIMSQLGGMTLESVLMDEVMEKSMEIMARIIPGFGTALMVFEGLGLAEYFTAAAMIAGYARSTDEIDMSSQAFALKIAELAVDSVKDKAKGAGKAVGVKAAKTAGKALKPKPTAPTVELPPVEIDTPAKPTVPVAKPGEPSLTPIADTGSKATAAPETSEALPESVAPRKQAVDEPTLESEPTRFESEPAKPVNQVGDEANIAPQGVSGRQAGLITYNIKTKQRAEEIYFEHIESDPLREVALVYDPDARTYEVIQGKAFKIPSAWIKGKFLISHHHPGADFPVRLPSGADYKVLYDWRGPNASFTSKITFVDPNTGEFAETSFGYSPADPARGQSAVFWVAYIDESGAQVTKTFSDPPWQKNSDFRKWKDPMIKKVPPPSATAPTGGKSLKSIDEDDDWPELTDAEAAQLVAGIDEDNGILELTDAKSAKLITDMLNQDLDALLTGGPPPQRPSATALSQAQANFKDNKATFDDYEVLLRQAVGDYHALQQADVVSPSAQSSTPADPKGKLSYKVLEGCCGRGRDVSSAALAEYARNSGQPIDILRHHTLKLFDDNAFVGGFKNNHSFSVVKFFDQTYILDPTFAQFLEPGLLPTPGGSYGNFTATVLRDDPKGLQMMNDLVQNGFVPLTPNNAQLYTLAMGIDPAKVDSMSTRLTQNFRAIYYETAGAGLNPRLKESVNRADIASRKEIIAIYEPLVAKLSAMGDPLGLVPQLEALFKLLK